MKFFVIPDIHGHFSSLEGLLRTAGVIDEAGQRVEGITTIQLGDLCNAVVSSINGDRECLLKVRDWIDHLLVGNHEMPWIWPGVAVFGGFHDDGMNGGYYRALMRDGILKPAVLIEDKVLVTHAGVHKDYQFETAVEAYDAIWDVWETPLSRAEKLGTIGPIPKRALLYGGSQRRGFRDRYPGIFWKDWNETPNKKFSQIVGHTPISKPDLWRREDGTFTVNIDCGAKHGRGATGMFYDNGEIEFVSYSAEPEPEYMPRVKEGRA